jgi:hypothetical protein
MAQRQCYGVTSQGCVRRPVERDRDAELLPPGMQTTRHVAGHARRTTNRWFTRLVYDAARVQEAPGHSNGLERFCGTFRPYACRRLPLSPVTTPSFKSFVMRLRDIHSPVTVCVERKVHARILQSTIEFAMALCFFPFSRSQSRR